MKEYNAGVVMMIQYAESWTGDYVDYVIDKKKSEVFESLEESNDQELQKSNYTDYIIDQKKNNFEIDGELIKSKGFDLTGELSDEEILGKKKEFYNSQKKESILWKAVISFDPKYLEELELLDPKLRDIELKKSITSGVENFLLKEGFDLANTNVIMGMHYNTDHPHVHIAFSEKEPTRWKGRVSEESLSTCKSIINNSLDKNKLLLQKLNDLDKELLKVTNEKLQEINKLNDLQKISEMLPEKGRTSYKFVDQKGRKYIEDFAQKYLFTDEKYIEFTELAKEEEEKLKRRYGKSSNNNYAENKINRLNEKIYNSIIKNAKIEENIIDKKSYREIQSQSGHSSNSNKRKWEKIRNQNLMRKSLRRIESEQNNILTYKESSIGH